MIICFKASDCGHCICLEHAVGVVGDGSDAVDVQRPPLPISIHGEHTLRQGQICKVGIRILALALPLALVAATVDALVGALAIGGRVCRIWFAIVALATISICIRILICNFVAASAF